jgi:hypothetical protein
MPAGATEPVYAEYIEHYPPETNAAALWLSNRQRSRWKLKQLDDVDQTNELKVTVVGGFKDE